jgi:hypothetical protein
MANPDQNTVTALVRPLPAEIAPAQNLSPNEMRAVKEATGRSLTELLGGDPSDLDMAPDRLQALIWCALRRAGWPDVTWDEAGDVVAQTDEPDPTATG